MDINEQIAAAHSELWEAVKTHDEPRVTRIALTGAYPNEADRLALLLGKECESYDNDTGQSVVPTQCISMSQHLGRLLREIHGGPVDGIGKLQFALDGYVCWSASLIASGVDLSDPSLMIFAVQYDDSTIIDLLLEAGAPVNLEWKGLTPLIHAIWSKETVRRLIRAGADVNFKTESGLTALGAIRDTSFRRMSESDRLAIEEMLSQAGAR